MQGVPACVHTCTDLPDLRNIIGTSLSKPHTDEFAVEFVYIYIYRTSCCKSLPALILRIRHSLQGVVTYTSPIEVFATTIKNPDWWKSSLIAPFRGSWLLDFTGVQRTKRSHTSIVVWTPDPTGLREKPCLEVSWVLECCLQAARERKQTKPNYTTLINDLEAMGFSANLDILVLEVGSLGHFEKEAIATLHAILPNLTRSRISRLLLELSKIAVGCSSHIFHARRSATWNLNTPLIRLFPM